MVPGLVYAPKIMGGLLHLPSLPSIPMKSRILLAFLLLCTQSAFCNDTLRILSWNIFMVPPAIYKSDQVNRARMIGEVLEKSGADVIILQEAFMKKTRHMLEQKLSPVYPHNSGKPQGGGLFKINCGVWVLSRLPLEDVKFIPYKDCEGSDCFGKKGAYLFAVTKNGHRVYMLGTHVQSGPAVATRQKQFAQLVAETAHIPDTEPLLILGDLNTDLHATAEHQAMLQTLQAEDGPMTGQAYSYASDNDLAKRFFPEPNSTLDYLLVRDKSKKIASVTRTIHKFTSVSSGTYKFIDLSDHYALTGEVVFK